MTLQPGIGLHPHYPPLSLIDASPSIHLPPTHLWRHSTGGTAASIDHVRLIDGRSPVPWQSRFISMGRHLQFNLDGSFHGVPGWDI